MFIPFPSLKLRYIFRQTKEFDEDEDEEEEEEAGGSDDEGEGKKEQSPDDEEMGAGLGEEVGGSDGEGEGEKEQSQDDEEMASGVGDEVGGSDGEGEGEKEQSPDDEEMAAGVGEEVGGSDGAWNIGDGDFTAYRAPFSDFPLLEHHAHPFFVIMNALPKFRANLVSLTRKQRTLLNLMTSIETIWSGRLDSAPAQPSTSKRRRSDDEPPDDDDGDGGPKRRYKRKYKPTTSQLTPRKRRTRASASAAAKVDKGKGKAKQTRAKKERSRARSHRQSAYPTPHTSRSHKKISLFDEVSEVSAWVDAVAVAGPAEQADQIIVWSDNEDVRAPIRNWDNWRVSYKQPTERAKFCSSDWVMYLHSIPLWLPSYPYQKQ